MAVGGDVARRYHESTKHSYESVRRGARGLDWANKPHPYKEYVDVQAEPLPADLDRLLRFGAGVVRTRRGYEFRTYSSAGALYPIEVYVATAAGLHHFHPRELALRRLREQDVRANLAASAVAPELREARAVLALSGILWRTAWKYEARGYRHLWWDAGTMLANVLALEPRARVLSGFVDAEVNAVLGIAGRRETALALVAVGRAEATSEASRLPKLDLRVAPLSDTERDYGIADELHAASSFAAPEDVARFRASAGPTADVSQPEWSPELERVLRRRVSVREFAADSIAAEDLRSLLAEVMAPVALDARPTNRLAGIANAVDGLTSGVFDFDVADGFVIRRAGALRDLAQYLVLEQELGGRSAATLFLLTDLEGVLDDVGARGYRVAQLEAGIRAGRLQVGAFARGWGATASTFYDDDVSRVFDTTDSPMLAVAVGKRRPRRA